MFARLLLILFIIVASLEASFGAQTFDEYKSNATEYCNASARPWNQGTTSSIVPLIDFPQLETASINSFIARYRQDPKVIGNERERLTQDLATARIGEFSGFKTLEAARVVYRTSMNKLFACAVVTSRLNTLKDVQAVIKSRIKQDPSDLLKKIDNERRKIESVKSTLACNVDQTKKEVLNILANSSSKQYCYYRHYLSYLKSNLDEDLNTLQTIEQTVGQGSGTTKPTVIAEWNDTFRKYNDQITTEIARADGTLPRALRAYNEMDESYGVHVMLYFIYDDYIKLRDAISKYMNASSQLYQKAYNAQNPNK